MDPGRIVVVAGAGRCGSSIVMQMLHAAGVDLLGARPPSGEDGEWNERYLRDVAVIDEARGAAVKLLNPALLEHFPFGRPVDWIWCDRDVVEQVASIAKFAQVMFGIPMGDYPVLEAMRQLPQERATIFERIDAQVGQRVLVTTFEGLIEHPGIEAGRIRDYLGLEAPVREMAAVVVPRSTRCLKGMLEPALIEREDRRRRTPA